MKYLEIKYGSEVLNIEIERGLYVIMFDCENQKQHYKANFYATVIAKPRTQTVYADTALELGDTYTIQLKEIQGSVPTSVNPNDTISSVKSARHEPFGLKGFELEINGDVVRVATEKGRCIILISDNYGNPQIRFDGSHENRECIKHPMEVGDVVKVKFNVFDSEQLSTADVIKMTE